jgi:hypothetical protein
MRTRFDFTFDGVPEHEKDLTGQALSIRSNKIKRLTVQISG